MKAQLPGFMQATAGQYNQHLKEWSMYTFQYQGQTKHMGSMKSPAHHVVLVNAFCIQPPDYVKVQLLRVSDGGSCFFRAYFDPKQGKFIAASINGRA